MSADSNNKLFLVTPKMMNKYQTYIDECMQEYMPIEIVGEIVKYVFVQVYLGMLLNIEDRTGVIHPAFIMQIDYFNFRVHYFGWGKKHNETIDSYIYFTTTAKRKREHWWSISKTKYVQTKTK